MATKLEQTLARIVSPDAGAVASARARLDTLTKPLGSLGRLEDIAAQWASIRREEAALPIRKGAYVFAADHGVTEDGVSAYPREVTHQMVLNFLAEGAAINVLARLQHATLRVVDVGVDADLTHLPGLIHRKVSRGSDNMAQGVAMDEEKLYEALNVGIAEAEDAVASGINLIAIGEMGIGNTTAASAITCALTGASAILATGRGTGVDDDAYARKISVIERVLARHFEVQPYTDPFAILGRVGGLEIAAMTGMILGAAAHRVAILCDGFISTAAAAIAVAIEPKVLGYLIAGHQSLEPGHQVLLEHLGLVPLLSLNMRLGEGTGAVLAMSIVESAVALYLGMATFESAGVSKVDS